MSQNDAFFSVPKGLEAPGDRHYQISASGVALSPKPRGVWCQAAGSLTVEDDQGTSLSYTMAQGAVLGFRPHKVTAIASGTFYAWY